MGNAIIILILVIAFPIVIPIFIGILGVSIMGLLWLLKVAAPFILVAAVVAVLVKSGIARWIWDAAIVRERRLRVEENTARNADGGGDNSAV